MSSINVTSAPTLAFPTEDKVSEAILRTEKIVKIYGGRAVVNGIDIHVNRGEVVGLLGPNGAGKTTTFYLIVGLVRPNSGRVFFDNRDVTRFAMHRRARMGMGYLPQEESIFRKLTVEQNIMAILEMLPGKRREKKSNAVNSCFASLALRIWLGTRR